MASGSLKMALLELVVGGQIKRSAGSWRRMSRQAPSGYVTKNPSNYNTLLKRRGAFAIWFDEIMCWKPVLSGIMGGCESDLQGLSERTHRVVEIRVQARSEIRGGPALRFVFGDQCRTAWFRHAAWLRHLVRSAATVSTAGRPSLSLGCLTSSSVGLRHRASPRCSARGLHSCRPRRSGQPPASWPRRA